MQAKMPRLPNNSNRIAILGPTGTGKTVGAIWHLSRILRSVEERSHIPWVIFDYKCDDHIAQIERAEEVPVGFCPSKKQRGVFVVHPIPEVDDEAVNEMLWKLWERKYVGVYVDEGYMVAKIPAINALLTQGRSKHIPMIMLSQRPVWMPRFTFSEASFIQVYSYTDKRDEDTIRKFVPPLGDTSKLPDYHSFYYDVGRRSLYRLAPVPHESTILDTIDSKLRTKRRII